MPYMYLNPRLKSLSGIPGCACQCRNSGGIVGPQLGWMGLPEQASSELRELALGGLAIGMLYAAWRIFRFYMIDPYIYGN